MGIPSSELGSGWCFWHIWNQWCIPLLLLWHQIWFQEEEAVFIFEMGNRPDDKGEVSIHGRWDEFVTMICPTWDDMMWVLPFWWPWTDHIAYHWVSLMVIWFWYWLLWGALGHWVGTPQEVRLFGHEIISCHMMPFWGWILQFVEWISFLQDRKSVV